MKRHILSDGRGVPLAAVTTGANVHDKWLVGRVLDAIVVRAPRGPRRPAHLCLDKGYDNPSGCQALDRRGVCQGQAARAQRYTPHIRRSGEEKLDAAKRKRHSARRWVVERTLAWLSKCRAVLVRYDKKSCNYLALLKLACALLWFRRLMRLAA